MIEDDEGRLVLRGMLGSRGPYHYQTTPAQWQVREVTGGWQVMMIQDPVLGPGQELTNTGVWQCWGPELELTQHCHSFFLPQPGLLWLRSFFFNQSSFFGRHHDQILATACVLLDGGNSDNRWHQESCRYQSTLLGLMMTWLRMMLGPVLELTNMFDNIDTVM